MASLLRLADTKANKPGMTLMHFVAMEAEKTDKNLCDFHNKLVHTVSASRIIKQEVEAEFQKVSNKIVAMKATLNDEADLKQQMEPFLQEAELQLQEVQISLEKLARSVHNLIEFFCEDEEVFKLEECCSVFRTFCEKFSKALKENREWEKAELKKQEQERKRRSIATCSHREKDMENVELEFLLLQNYKDGWRNRSLKKTPNSSPVLRSEGLQRRTGKTANGQSLTKKGILNGEQNTQKGQVRVTQKNQSTSKQGRASGQQLGDNADQAQEKRTLQNVVNQTTGTQSSKLREHLAMFEQPSTCNKMGRRHTLPVIPFTRSESSEEVSSSKKRPMLSHAGRFFSVDGSPDVLTSNIGQEMQLQQTPRRNPAQVAEIKMTNGGETSTSTTLALEPKMTPHEKASSTPDCLNTREDGLRDTSPRHRITSFLQKMASPRAPDNLSRIIDGCEIKGSPKAVLENSPFVNFFKRQKKLWQKGPYPPPSGEKNEMDNEVLTTKVGADGS
ncbi:uncharacterized protein LOC122802559 [Protopterus annectens]|uniref:uncharacterized protein LOC122802559 n=1 Tax=Protopterus annectens TaxID=7888 RepID=UPI001CF99D12|nr:uncharacterized protein LOC122802559 [Protopterus annectens]